MDRPIWGPDFLGELEDFTEEMEDYADYLENLVDSLEDIVVEDMRLIHLSSKPVYLDGRVQDMKIGGDDDV